MLTQAIGELLPTAIGVALSPVPIIAVVLMLGTAKGRLNGLAFATGWAGGLVAVNVVVLAVAGGASDPDSTTSEGIDWLQVVFGVALVAMALRQWRKRPRAGEEPEMPKWMERLDAVAPPRALVLGALLSSVNPKNLALTLAAAGSIAQAGLSGGDEAIAVGCFVIVASLTVAGPVLVDLVAGERARTSLAAMKDFMAAHNAAILMVVLLVLGVKLLGEGFGAVT